MPRAACRVPSLPCRASPPSPAPRRLLLLAAGARAALPTTLRSWLLCVAAAVTLFDVIALGFNLVAGGCDATLSTAVLRPLATVVLYAMRGQATAFAVLVAHQACPVRSVRTRT